MGWRFRRSVRLFPGVRINLSRSGISTSIGVRGAHLTVGHGKVRETVGLPGTGLSYMHVGGQAHQEAKGEARPTSDQDILPKSRAGRGWLWILLSAAIVIAIGYGAASASTSDTSEVRDSYSVAIEATDRRGTEQHPLVISKSTEESRREAVDQAAHARNERAVTIATIVLAFFTVALWAANIWLIVESKHVSAAQAAATKRAIDEAKRSADAMQSVAEATRENAVRMTDIMHKQMRAYVSVDTGDAVYQDGRLKFASSPSITNTGFTPAKNLRHRVAAAILDLPLPPDYQFSDDKKMSEADATLSPRQNFTITGVVERRYEDAEVDLIMKGEKKRLFVWGTVTYEDVFGGTWQTKFCHNFNFFRATDKDEWKVGRFYHTSHNSTT